MQDEIVAADLVIAGLRARHAKATERLNAPEAKPPANGLADTEKAINQQRNLVGTQLARPLSADACEQAEGLLSTLENMVRDAKDELADLGGDAQALIQAFGGDDKALERADAAFGDRKKLRAACKAFKSPATLATLATSLGGGDLKKGAGTLEALGGALGPDEIVAAEKAVGGERLTALLAAAGDATKLKAAREALGDGGLDALAPTAGQAAVPFTLIDKVGGATAMKKLAADTGLGGKPKALAAMLTKGCGGDAQKCADALAAFGTNQERGQLKGVIEQGGLGDAPDCFGELLADGCGGRPGGLKAFTASFDMPGAREGLKRMLTDGGLAGKKNTTSGEVEIDPKCLSGLLKHAAGATKPNDPADDAKRGDTLAALFRDLDTTACEHLSDLMAQGGLGTEPDVLGHVIGTGCADGTTKVADAAKVKALGAAFQTPTPAPVPLPAAWPPLTALKNLVGKGGFGTKDTTGSATNTDPKCLGAMLGTGCEGKAADLVTLTTALADQDRTNLAKVLKDGELGTRPNVLANSYKFGCLSDPYDPTSAKKPDHLKTLASTFGTTPNAPKLKNLLVDGGLGDEANHPEWLGKVMRDGFTPPNYMPAKAPPPAPPPPPPPPLVQPRDPPPVPSGKAQNPAKLLNLHDAFSGQMPKLKTMIDAMGTMPPSCGAADEPGKGLQNVVRALKPNLNDGIADLQRFYNAINARSGGPNVRGPTAGIHVPGGFPPAASLTGTQLIQQAASMEFTPVVAPNIQISGYDTDVGHVMERHNRTGQARKANGDNNTSMLPKSAMEEDVRSIIRACIANCTQARAKPGQTPPALNSVSHPPTVRNHLWQNPYNGAYNRQYENVPGGGAVGTIGFKWANHRVQVGQFYPTGGANVDTINARDLMAIKTALNKLP